MNIFFVLSLVAFALGCIWLIAGCIFRKIKDSRFIGFTITTIAAISFLHFGADTGESINGFERALLALLEAFKVIAGNAEVRDTKSLVLSMAEGCGQGIRVYASLLHLAASSIVIGVIAHVLDRIFPKIKYMLMPKLKDIYFFSGITERGVLLAEDIRKNKLGTVVFVKNNVCDESLEKRLQDIGAYVFVNDIDKISKPLFTWTANITFFLLKDNHDENVNEAIKLAEKYREKAVNIHILSDNMELTDLLDTVVKRGECKCVLNLINEAKMMIYDVLDRNPLFLTPENRSDILVIGAGKNGQAAIKACSWCGYTLKREPKIWVIDRDDAPAKKLEKDAPEMMSKIRDAYKTMDVESIDFINFLRENRDRIGYVICALGDDHLNLRTAMDVRRVSYEVEPFCPKNAKLPYIHVLLNDAFLSEKVKELKFDSYRVHEKDSVEKATECKEKWIKCGDEAIGCAEPTRRFVYEQVDDRSYEILPYGELKAFYTWENICNSRLESYGRVADAQYGTNNDEKEKEKAEEQNKQIEVVETTQEKNSAYNKSNYYKDSSIATGLHAKYRLFELTECAMSEDAALKNVAELKELPSIEELIKVDWKKADAPESRENKIKSIIEECLKNEDLVNKLAEREHLRWCAYMKSEGWTTPADTESPAWRRETISIDHKNFGAKQHQCLVVWDELPNVKVKDKEGDLKDFKENDRVMVRATCKILEGVNKE